MDSRHAPFCPLTLGGVGTGGGKEGRPGSCGPSEIRRRRAAPGSHRPLRGAGCWEQRGADSLAGFEAQSFGPGAGLRVPGKLGPASPLVPSEVSSALLVASQRPVTLGRTPGGVLQPREEPAGICYDGPRFLQVRKESVGSPPGERSLGLGLCTVAHAGAKHGARTQQGWTPRSSLFTLPYLVGESTEGQFLQAMCICPGLRMCTVGGHELMLLSVLGSSLLHQERTLVMDLQSQRRRLPPSNRPQGVSRPSSQSSRGSQAQLCCFSGPEYWRRNTSREHPCWLLAQCAQLNISQVLGSCSGSFLTSKPICNHTPICRHPSLRLSC